MIGDEKDASSWISRVCATSIVPVFFTWISLFFLYRIVEQKMEKGKVLSEQSDGRGFLRERRTIFSILPFSRCVFYTYLWSIKQNRYRNE